MIELSLSAINVKSPYKMSQTANGSFLFVTDYGKEYEVGFVEDEMFSFPDVYQLFIKDNDRKHC